MYLLPTNIIVSLNPCRFHPNFDGGNFSAQGSSIKPVSVDGLSDVFVWVFVKGHALIHSRNWEGHDFFRQNFLPHLDVVIVCIFACIRGNIEIFAQIETVG